MEQIGPNASSESVAKAARASRWAFVELTDVWQIEVELAAKIEKAFDQAFAAAIGGAH